MEKETLFIAFSTQKGGAGKTTLTVLVASYLHYVKGMNVAVVDCDYPQHSIAEMRKRDLKTVMEDEHYKLMAYRQLQRIRKKAYPVAESTAEDAVTKADELLEKMPETDIVFFDLPGTVNSTGVLNTLANMDYVFSPITAARVVMESTLRFASRLNDTLIATGKTNIKGLYLLWNMVDGREKSELYKVYEQVIGELGLKVLNTFLPDSKRFRRELTGEHRALFRSTLFPADGTLVKGSNLKEITEELLSIIRKEAMGNERKKINLTDIDENSIVASFKEGRPADGQAQAAGNKGQSGEESGYVRLFIHESPVCARLGKTIYLRKEFHERIQRIVQTIGNNEMSIFSYVDNVLEQHFAAYQDEITKEYRKRSTELF